MSMMDPFDLVMVCLDSLTPKQKQEVIDKLSKEVNPCAKTGHKFKPLKTIPASGWLWWRKPTKQVYFCEKCSQTREL